MKLPNSVIGALAAGLATLRLAPEKRLDLLSRVSGRTLISDRIFGGASDVVLEPTRQGIRFRYGLSPVSSHPWAGLNLKLSDSLRGPLDLGAWERLEIRARCTRGRPLRIHLLSDDASPGLGVRDSVNLIYHAMEFTPDGELELFPWTAFTIPSWWQVQRSRSDVQRLDLLDRLRSIEFHSGDSPTGRDSSTVEILKLDLVGPDRTAKAIGWMLVLLGAGGVGFVLVGLRQKSEPRLGAPGSPLVPDRVVLDDPRARQREQLVAALRETFADPELGLENFAASRGMSPRLVATLIKEATHLHFKGALNELRLTEAARLLKESQGNVSEIAYAVGFQNPSHFGRAFRERFGVPPSDFRGGVVPEESED